MKPRSGQRPRHSAETASSSSARAGLDLAHLQDARPVPSLFQAGYRLADLADGPALEREVPRHHHSFVTEVDGLEPHGLVHGKKPFPRGEDRHPPAARLRDPAELRDELAGFGLVADRVTAHERDAVDDPVREERASARREEVALVAAQGEEAQRVAAGLADYALGRSPCNRALLQLRGDGTEPEVERAEEENPEEDRERVADLLRQRDQTRRVGREGAHEGSGRDHLEQEGPHRARTAADGERPPVGEQTGQYDQARRRLFDVEPLDQMRDGRSGHEDEGELPCAPLAARQRERQPEQRDTEGDRDRARELHRALRKGATDDLRAGGEIRGERRDDADRADQGRSDGEYFVRCDDRCTQAGEG